MLQKITNVFKRIWADVKAYKIGVIICILYYVITLNLFKASCPMILLTGLPCPGCGLTRSVVYILTFRFAKAFATNPASYAWVAFILYFIIARYILGRKLKHLDLILILVALITIAVYIRGMIVYYPNRIPYVHTTHNLFHYLSHR